MKVSKHRLLWGGLFYKKLRLFLSLLGIIIGVAALIVMNSFGESAQVKTLKEISTFGPDVLLVVAGSVQVHGGRAIQTELATTLKPSDAKALRAIDGIKYISPVFNGLGIVRNEKNTYVTTITGVNPEYLKIRRFPLEEGRNFLNSEIQSYEKVAILGYKVKKELFGDEDPIGKHIYVNKLPFKVIGVLGPIGIDASGEDQDDQILVPYTVAMSALYNVDYIKSIYIRVSDIHLIPFIVKRIDQILLKRHHVTEKDKDFSIVKAEDILEAKTRTTKIFASLVGSISVLCLLVGALGVTAIMTLSVNERKKEIGIRKALGAKERDLVYQFLMESIFITVVGGVIGIFLGLGISFVLLPVLHYPIVMPWLPIVISVGLTIIFGLIAGIYPAYKAAKVDPIILLRQGF